MDQNSKAEIVNNQKGCNYKTIKDILNIMAYVESKETETRKHES